MGTKPDLPLPNSTRCPDTASSALRILVAEDNLTNQKVILRQLQSLGYIADLVSDGQAAVAATAQAAYHIVLMDCRLPQIDGYEATRLIRQREQANQSARTIIIALTASDHSQAEHQAIAAGMDDFLTKPLRRETLAAALTKWSQVLQQTDQTQSIVAGLNRSVRFPEPARLALYFDLVRLHQLSDWNQEFEQELLQLYLDDMQGQIQQLLHANSKQNFSQIERTAHHIRGASASVGAFQLEALSEKLEFQAQQKHPTTANLVEQFKQMFEQVQMLFQAEELS